MGMKYKIFKRLDRRNTGFGHWEYYLDRPRFLHTSQPHYSSNIMKLYDSQQQFFKWREWCWKTWGSSKELDDWLEDLRNPRDQIIGHNEHWCWQHNQYNTRIYLRSDKELSIFLLQWSV